MWLAPIVKILVLTALGTEAGADAPADQALPQSIATRQTLFAIPFRIDEPTQPGQEPVEVQLFASGDRGASWHLYAKAAPGQGSFMFRAGGDGEFWFVVRTMDRSGQLRPERVASPGLRVVVDTALPKLELQARRGAAGQVSAIWQIDEQSLDTGSLSIQYRTGDQSPWQAIALDPQSLRTSGTIHSGEVAWLPEAGTGPVQIRAEVSDRAGNVAVSHAQLETIPAAGTPPQVASTLPPTGGSQPLTSVADAGSAWRAGAPATSGAAWPTEQTLNRPAPTQAGLSPLDGPYAAGMPPANAPTGSLVPTNPGPASAAVAAGTYPPVANQYVPPGNAATPPGTAVLPVADRPRMVGSRLFELEYDVTSVGPSGLARVELWGTEDGGQSWRSFALDDDNRSPLLVSVEREGIYGFRVVVTSGAGLGGQAPARGELPDIIVGVDTTKPAARILAADQGAGSEAGNLIITWEAGDQMLAVRPITLSFSESSGGPWTTIATGLENTGRYVWPIDERLPRNLYLRVEARDEAGNSGVSETNQSVTLDRFRPAGLIRDVRPMSQASRPAAPSRYGYR